MSCVFCLRTASQAEFEQTRFTSMVYLTGGNLLLDLGRFPDSLIRWILKWEEWKAGGGRYQTSLSRDAVKLSTRRESSRRVWVFAVPNSGAELQDLTLSSR